MKAGSGVALSLAAMVAVAAVVPAVVATTGPTVHMAAAMATATFFLMGIRLVCPHAGQSRVQATVFD